MMANVPHVTSGLGLRKFQADGFLLTRVYLCFVAVGLVTMWHLQIQLMSKFYKHVSIYIYREIFIFFTPVLQCYIISACYIVLK